MAGEGGVGPAASWSPPLLLTSLGDVMNKLYLLREQFLACVITTCIILYANSLFGCYAFRASPGACCLLEDLTAAGAAILMATALLAGCPARIRCSMV
jgi:hypothetical protein